MSGISSAASGGPCNFSAPGPDFDFDDDEHDFVNPLEYFIAEIIRTRNEIIMWRFMMENKAFCATTKQFAA